MSPQKHPTQVLANEPHVAAVDLESWLLDRPNECIKLAEQAPPANRTCAALRRSQSRRNPRLPDSRPKASPSHPPGTAIFLIRVSPQARLSLITHAQQKAAIVPTINAPQLIRPDLSPSRFYMSVICDSFYNNPDLGALMIERTEHIFALRHITTRQHRAIFTASMTNNQL